MLTYSVDGGNMKPAWARRDIFFSEKDIVKSLQKEVEAMNKVIAHNKFREIAPYGVTVNVELTQEPRIVYVEKIEIRDKKELYSPGDKLTVDVTFRPWRKDAVVKTFELTVPENAMAFCEVTARGGGIEEPVQEPLVTGTRAITSFKELIRELSAKEANNQLIVEIGGPEDPTEGKDEKAEPGKNRGKLASDATAGKDGGKDRQEGRKRILLARGPARRPLRQRNQGRAHQIRCFGHRRHELLRRRRAAHLHQNQAERRRRRDERRTARRADSRRPVLQIRGKGQNRRW